MPLLCWLSKLERYVLLCGQKYQKPPAGNASAARLRARLKIFHDAKLFFTAPPQPHPAPSPFNAGKVGGTFQITKQLAVSFQTWKIGRFESRDTESFPPEHVNT